MCQARSRTQEFKAETLTEHGASDVNPVCLKSSVPALKLRSQCACALGACAVTFDLVFCGLQDPATHMVFPRGPLKALFPGSCGEVWLEPGKPATQAHYNTFEPRKPATQGCPVKQGLAK
eukprot:1158660-Pelagomonas_calceolata.AAC.2